jgi:DNA-binding LytR/AlgR family response regulator
MGSRHWTACGEAENGWSGVKKFQELKPDVVLLDLAMLDINGIEAAKLSLGPGVASAGFIAQDNLVRICDWRSV